MGSYVPKSTFIISTIGKPRPSQKVLSHLDTFEAPTYDKPNITLNKSFSSASLFNNMAKVVLFTFCLLAVFIQSVSKCMAQISQKDGTVLLANNLLIILLAKDKYPLFIKNISVYERQLKVLWTREY